MFYYSINASMYLYVNFILNMNIKQVFVTTNIMYNTTHIIITLLHTIISILGNIFFKINDFEHCTQEHTCSPYVIGRYLV